MKRVLLLFFPSLMLAQGYTSYFTGNPNNIDTGPSFGICMMGGATEHDGAMEWLLNKADGGDIVVLRSSGSDGYNDYLYSELGVIVNSVETLVITSAAGATNPYVLNKVANAEMIWFAGGDQFNYVSYFKDNALEDLLQAHVNEKHYPIGGTSAGMAILGSHYFSAQNGSVTSSAALANPYNANVTVGANDFLSVPFLQDVITDTHFDNPDRRGRLSVFLARMAKDSGIRSFGIACNEYVAVCVDEEGKARVYGEYPEYEEFAFFLQSGCGDNFGPENCAAGTPLTWNQGGEAIKVYKVPGTMTGTNYFRLDDWQTGSGGAWRHWYVQDGVFSDVAGTASECALSVTDEKESRISAYPLPFTDELVLEAAGQHGVRFYDLSGRCVRDVSFRGKIHLDTAAWASGLYIAEWRHEGKTERRKYLRN